MAIEAAPSPALRTCSAASPAPTSPAPPPAASSPQCPPRPQRRCLIVGRLALVVSNHSDHRPEHQPHEGGCRLHYELQLCCFSTRYPARDSIAIACSRSEKCSESWICFTRKKLRGT